MKRKNPYPGVTPVTDRHGKRRWRFRSTKVKCYLKGEYGSEEFIREYEIARSGRRPDGKDDKLSRLNPSTFRWLIQSYRASPKFQNLRQTTRHHQSYDFEWILGYIGDLPFASFTLKHVENLMQKKGGPSAANNIRKRMVALFHYAIRLELMTNNPARVSEKHRENDDGFYTWTDADIERFRDAYPSGTRERLVLELTLNTGAARQDLTRMGRQSIESGRIKYRRGKTEQDGDARIEHELAVELEQVPVDQMLFILDHNGRPFKPRALSQWFTRRVRQAGIAQGSLHGLRKAAATRLANAGASEREIGAFLAHSGTQQAATYTKKADRTRLTDSALDKLHGTKTVHILSNPPKRLDKK